MTSREKILASLRGAAYARAGADASRPAPADDSYDDLPGRGALVAQFAALARAESASVQHVENMADVPSAVGEYLRTNDLPERLVVAQNASTMDWSALDVIAGPVAADGDTVCTGCYAGIAEAGALVVLSDADHPTEFNFLAATHIAILPSASILPTFEQVWTKLANDGLATSMPRMMNFIVGPSRTADLGVPSKLGAHGPARLHILVVEQGNI